MNAHLPCHVRMPSLRRFARDESGATLVEFALVVLLFLTLLFASIDIGRLAHSWAAAQKATQIAARIAAVRPPVCAGVPEMHDRGVAGAGTSFGTLCRAGAGVCRDPGPATCAGVAAHPTVAEIFARIRPLLPANTTEANLRFSYQFDPNLGFLGGPYVPLVTVDLDCVDFVFATRLDAIITGLSEDLSHVGCPVGDARPPIGIRLPRMSVSVPGEDLAQGTAG